MSDSGPSAVRIFTDGACTGNPGPGGWGSIVLFPDGTVQELGAAVPETTNNRMEMAAAIHALQKLEPQEGCTITVYTDSVYLIRGITQWIWGWRAKGWKNAEGKDVANRNLWEELARQVSRLKPCNIEWKYVRGHNGNPGNERCDQIAVAFANGKREALYSGPRDGYFVDLDELPAEDSLPEAKSGGSGSTKGGASKGGGGGGPTSYLSLHNGVLMRHTTWSDCERRVKGQSGAKFKKAKSRSEEQQILKDWGLDPNTAIG